MNNYDKLYTEFYKKAAADFDIDAVKKRIAAVKEKTRMPVDSASPEQKPYYQGLSGRPIPRFAIPSAIYDDEAPATTRPVQKVAPKPTTTRPVQRVVPTPTVTRPTQTVAPKQVAQNTNTPTPSAPRAPQPTIVAPNIKPPTIPIVVPRVPQRVPASRNTPAIPAPAKAPVLAPTKATTPAQAPSPAKAAQTATTVQNQPEIQTLPNTDIQYRQYAENDPLVRKYKKRLRHMGFARFDENGPWIATPHGTDGRITLPRGLDRGVIQAMLAEGKVPVGVFEASTLAAQQFKAAQQLTTPANVARQISPSSNVVQQTAPQVPAARQMTPSANAVRPARRTSKRRAPTVAEALKMREQRIIDEGYRKHPILAQIRDHKLRMKAIKDKMEKERQLHFQYQLEKMALANDILNKHVPYNTDYKMTPEQKARWDAYKQNPELFPFGDINNYYNKPTPLNAADLPPKTIGQKFEDFYNWDIVPAYMNAKVNGGRVLDTLTAPIRQTANLWSKTPFF